MRLCTQKPPRFSSRRFLFRILPRGTPAVKALRITLLRGTSNLLNYPPARNRTSNARSAISRYIHLTTGGVWCILVFFARSGKQKRRGVGPPLSGNQRFPTERTPGTFCRVRRDSHDVFEGSSQTSRGHSTSWREASLRASPSFSATTTITICPGSVRFFSSNLRTNLFIGWRYTTAKKPATPDVGRRVPQLCLRVRNRDIP